MPGVLEKLQMGPDFPEDVFLTASQKVDFVHSVSILGALKMFS